MPRMQGCYCIVELIYDVETVNGIYKTGERYKLTGMALAWMALHIGPDHYHIIPKESSIIIEEKRDTE